MLSVELLLPCSFLLSAPGARALPRWYPGTGSPGLCPPRRESQSESLGGTRRPAAAGFVLRGRERLETDAGEAVAVGAGTDPAGLYRNAVSSARHCLKSPIGKDDIHAPRRDARWEAAPLSKRLRGDGHRDGAGKGQL